MLQFQEQIYNRKSSPSSPVYLVADIGGTNSTFAFIEETKGKFSLLVKLKFQSASISDFTKAVVQVLEYGQHTCSFHPKAACFAAAGVVSEKNDFCTITKLPWNIDAQKIQQQTSLRSVLIINDFIGVAYGISALPAKSIVQLKKGNIVPQKPKAILGAGTGLGKAVLIWNPQGSRYIPIASEGGHSDAALQTPQEYALGEFIKKLYHRERVVWEDMVSGKGISNIYQFLENTRRFPHTKYSLKVNESNYDPALISNSLSDPQCLAAWNIFVRFQARCAQNLALDVMAQGGVYIAGGIVAKNLSAFKRKAFIDEFILNHRMKKVLEKIPLFAITDYDAGLYGAAKALLLSMQGNFP